VDFCRRSFLTISPSSSELTPSSSEFKLGRVLCVVSIVGTMELLSCDSAWSLFDFGDDDLFSAEPNASAAADGFIV
jgi:hypothetical protein